MEVPMSKKKGKKKSRGKSKNKKGKAVQRKNARVQRAQELTEQEQRAEENSTEENSEEEKKARKERALARVQRAQELKAQELKAQELRALEQTVEEQRKEAQRAEAQRREDQRAEERRDSDRRAEERRAADRQAKAALSEDAEPILPMPEPPGFWQRHDLGVLFFALAVFAGGTLVSRQLATPKQIQFAKSGLQFQRPSGWLPAQSTPAKAAGLANTTSGFGVAKASPSSADTGQHFVYQAPRDSRQRIEVRIGPRPPYRNLRGARAIERLGQYGEFYWEAESSDRSIARRDWVRSEFRYAFKPSKSGSPQIANAVEYATIQDARLYVVTLHGDPKSMTELDKLIAPTLRIDNAGAGNSPPAEGSAP